MFRPLACVICCGALLLAQSNEVSAPSVAAFSAKVEALIKSHQTIEALQELRRMLDSHSGDAEAEFQAAQLLEQLASMRFAELERLAPNAAETHLLLGKRYEAQGKLKDALGEYQRAQARSSGLPGLHFLIGNVYWKLRDFDAAAPELSAELKLNANHAGASFRLGSILLARDEAERAVPFLEAAVRNDPDMLDARRELGKALRHTGRLREALRELRVVAARRPQDGSVHAQLALVYRALGQPERAKEELVIHQSILKRKLTASQESFERRQQ
jgi:tetratricopeptide (TPR) repeat protein